jgi:hypothetical protein
VVAAIALIVAMVARSGTHHARASGLTLADPKSPPSHDDPPPTLGEDRAFHPEPKRSPPSYRCTCAPTDPLCSCIR